MPKMKTNRAAAKRLWKTGSGKIRRGHAAKSHRMLHGNSSSSHLRGLRKRGLVDKADEKRTLPLIPYL